MSFLRDLILTEHMFMRERSLSRATEAAQSDIFNDR